MAGHRRTVYIGQHKQIKETPRSVLIHIKITKKQTIHPKLQQNSSMHTTYSTDHANNFLTFIIL